MSFRTSFLGTIDRLRALPGPAGFDLRTFTVTRRIRSWTGTEDGGPEIGVGYASSELLEITPRPKVKELDDGKALLVGPVTPSHATGGFAPEELNPRTLVAGQEVDWLVVGPSGETNRYALVRIDQTKALRYMLELRLLERDIPV